MWEDRALTLKLWDLIERLVLRWGEGQTQVDAWRYQYNHVRPHSSLNYLTPVVFAEQAA